MSGIYKMACQMSFRGQACGVLALKNLHKSPIANRNILYNRSFGINANMNMVLGTRNFGAKSVEGGKDLGSSPSAPMVTESDLDKDVLATFQRTKYLPCKARKYSFPLYPLRTKSFDALVQRIHERALREGNMFQQGHAQFYAGLISDLIDISFSGVFKREINPLPHNVDSEYRLVDKFTTARGSGILVIDGMDRVDMESKCFQSITKLISQMNGPITGRGPFHIIFVNGLTFRIFHFTEGSRRDMRHIKANINIEPEEHEMIAWCREGQTNGKGVKIFSVPEWDGPDTAKEFLNGLNPATNILFYILLKSFQNELHLGLKGEQEYGCNMGVAMWRHMHVLSEWCRGVLLSSYEGPENRGLMGKDCQYHGMMLGKQELATRGHMVLDQLTTTYNELIRGKLGDNSSNLLLALQEMNSENEEGDDEECDAE